MVIHADCCPLGKSLPRPENRPRQILVDDTAPANNPEIRGLG
jgi:hypothetical protein